MASYTSFSRRLMNGLGKTTEIATNMINPGMINPVNVLTSGASPTSAAMVKIAANSVKATTLGQVFLCSMSNCQVFTGLLGASHTD